MRLVVLGLMVLAALCAACASPTPTPAPNIAPTVVPTPATKIDPRGSVPCSIISDAEASQIFGKPVRASAMGNVPNLDNANFIVCSYTTPAPPITGFSFTVFGRKDAASADKLFAQSKAEDVADNRYTPVNGLGQEAYWDGALLLVRHGEIVIAVAGAKQTGKPDFDMVKTVAEIVMERIQ